MSIGKIFIFAAIVAVVAVNALDHPRLSPQLFGTALDRFAKARGAVEAQFFDQVIDHTQGPKSATFKQRFYEVKDYWEAPTGPIILYIAGEAPQEHAAGIDDEVGVIAKQNKALVLTLEHRYFGKSMPYGDLSTPHLKYLTIAQVLEDLNSFVMWYQRERINAVYNTTARNKALCVGGSYAGMVSSHLRYVHPETFDVAWSSSGVVDAVFNFTTFDLQVAVSVGQECADVLRQATARVEELLQTRNSYVKRLFHAEDMSDDDLMWMLSDAETLPPQYGTEAALCKPMTAAHQAGQDLAVAFAQFCESTFYPQFCAGAGPQLYSDRLMQDVNASTAYAGQRAWWWYCCNELAYAQTYPGEIGIRSPRITLDFHKRKCDAVYGPGIWPPNTAAFNKKYGGRHPKTTNVVYLNGSQDPWQWAAVRTSPDMKRLPTYVLNGPSIAHCHDLSKETPTDPDNVKAGRRAAEDFVRSILSA